MSFQIFYMGDNSLKKLLCFLGVIIMALGMMPCVAGVGHAEEEEPITFTGQADYNDKVGIVYVAFTDTVKDIFSPEDAWTFTARQKESFDVDANDSYATFLLVFDYSTEETPYLVKVQYYDGVGTIKMDLTEFLKTDTAHYSIPDFWGGICLLRF